MAVTLMQTADAVFYYPMLIETAKTVRAYCARNGFAYEQYVGVKRGHMPWQATFNRLFMLKEMVDRGVEGWVLYLDADAFIQDLDFDLASYLQDRSHAAAIFSGYSTCEVAYDINAGGFAINLSHPLGRSIIQDWYQTIAIVPAEVFDGAVYWEHDLANDQHLLWGVLRRYVEDLELTEHLIFERANHSYVNNGPFITQLLRSFFPTFADRLAAVRDRVSTILAAEPERRATEDPGIFMPAGHPRLVTAVGRKVYSGIRSTGEPGGLMFGPYIRLAAGRYTARIFGEVRLREDQQTLRFEADVSTEKGHVVPATLNCVFDSSAKGIIAEFPFEIAASTDSFEVRVIVGDGADISIHAVQIVPRS